ncbi:hypothetical protein VNI00_010587 [Paramarasmius palmivorus]|uniref:Uncharacterized protein n=1 Tax=Paramarasmius palmivorus TaxID=297713 RepID=A0AAW0CM21_9AGAR
MVSTTLRNPSQARPPTTKRPSSDTFPGIHDVLGGKMHSRGPYPMPPRALKNDGHNAVVPHAPKARTWCVDQENVSPHTLAKRADEEQIKLWAQEISSVKTKGDIRVREAGGMGKGGVPMKRPGLVRKVASDILPPSRPVLTTANRANTFPPAISNPFPLQPAPLQRQPSQAPSITPVLVEPLEPGDRSVPQFTNPFDNNKPLDPLPRLKRSDYKPLPKKFLQPKGTKPAEKSSRNPLLWVFRPNPVPAPSRKRVRTAPPTKTRDISPFDTSGMTEEEKVLSRRLLSQENEDYWRAVEQSNVPFRARQREIRHAEPGEKPARPIRPKVSMSSVFSYLHRN